VEDDVDSLVLLSLGVVMLPAYYIVVCLYRWIVLLLLLFIYFINDVRRMCSLFFFVFSEKETMRRAFLFRGEFGEFSTFNRLVEGIYISTFFDVYSYVFAGINVDVQFYLAWYIMFKT